MKNINYSDFSELDFVTDDAFIQWVRNPDDESNEFWFNWIKEHPDKQLIVNHAIKVLLSIKVEDIKWDYDHKRSLKEKILMRIKIGNTRLNSQRRRSKKIFLYTGAAAAIAGIIFMLSFWVWSAKGQVNYHTAYGEIQKITLPDHSIVTLGANSDLSYKVDRQHNIRKVILKGEAYFNVSKDATKPFLVHINDIIVKVLGTQFDINQTGHITTIVLQSGKVRLLLPDTAEKAGIQNTLDMYPGELVSYSEASHVVIRKKLDNTDAYTAWKDHLLIFDKTTLQQIAKKIYDIYGLYLKFPRDMLHQTFSAEVHIEDKYPETLLKLLSESFQLDMTRKDDTIYATRHIH